MLHNSCINKSRWVATLLRCVRWIVSTASFHAMRSRNYAWQCLLAPHPQAHLPFPGWGAIGRAGFPLA